MRDDQPALDQRQGRVGEGGEAARPASRSSRPRLPPTPSCGIAESMIERNSSGGTSCDQRLGDGRAHVGQEHPPVGPGEPPDAAGHGPVEPGPGDLLAVGPEQAARAAAGPSDAHQGRLRRRAGNEIAHPGPLGTVPGAQSGDDGAGPRRLSRPRTRGRRAGSGSGSSTSSGTPSPSPSPASSSDAGVVAVAAGPAEGPAVTPSAPFPPAAWPLPATPSVVSSSSLPGRAGVPPAVRRRTMTTSDAAARA